MIGKTISHYRILEKLGEGGMGVVYRAHDTRLDRDVALKFLPAELTRDPDAKRRFINEARAASALQHENICVIHDVDETDDGPAYAGAPAPARRTGSHLAGGAGQIFICMEWYRGTTLRERIRRETLKVTEAMEIAAQIARGLLKAHENGIVHRDIKPENIMVTNDGVAKIMDFGLAKLRGKAGQTRTGRTPGTIAYMSPEQLRGDPVDERSDVWSFGVLLFEMLTGRLPFRGDHEPAIIYSITNEDPQDIRLLRRETPERMAVFCKRCLMKDPADRPDLHEIVAPPALFTREPASIAGRRGTGVRSRRVLQACIGFCIAAVVIGVALLKPFGRKPATLPTARVAITPFTNKTGDPATGDWPNLVQSMFVEQLTGVERVGVLDPVHLQNIIESSIGGMPVTRDAGVLDALNRYEVTLVIDGTIVRGKRGYTLQANMVEPSSSLLRFTVSTHLPGEAELPGAVSHLSSQILAYIDVHVLGTEDLNEMRPWLSHRSRNMRAVREFALAGEHILSNIRGAEEHLCRSVDLDSHYISPRIWLISAMVQDGRNEQARAHYRLLSRLHGSASPFEQAMIEWAGASIDGDLRKQAESLAGALQYSPGNFILLVNLAGCQARMDDAQGALETLEPMLRTRWRFRALYPFAADCNLKLGRFDEAQTLLEETQDQTKGITYVQAQLAFLALRRGDTVAAARHEAKGLETQRATTGSAGGFHALVGSLCMEYRCFEQAGREFRKAFVVEPESLSYRELQADALFHAGDREGAKELCLAVVKADAARPHAHLALGRLREADSDTTGAVACYSTVLRLGAVGADAESARVRLAALRR